MEVRISAVMGELHDQKQVKFVDMKISFCKGFDSVYKVKHY